MPDSPLATAHRHLTEAIDELRAAAGSGATDDELLSVLTLYEGTRRRLDRLTVTTLSDLQRRATRRGSGRRRGFWVVSQECAECLCDGREGDVPVPSEVASAFEVVETEAVFEFSVVVFDAPADLRETHQFT